MLAPPAPGPIFALCPADVSPVVAGLTGASLCLATWGLLVAHRETALAVRLDPTTMSALGLVMLEAGRRLGADMEAARQLVQQATPVEQLHAIAH